MYIYCVLQSNEVANSYAMEKEGLIRALDFLINDNQLQISHLVTDRHSAVKKFMREQHPDIQHWFDVWHVAKGLYYVHLTLSRLNTLLSD